VDTQSLRLFVRAAEKRNISAAGHELGMAPAVASNRLAKLEHHLGADLLHRSTRKVALSVEGAQFLPYAKEMLAQEAAAMAALGQGKATVSGTIRFTAPSSFAQLYVTPLIAEFMGLYPEVDLELRLSDARFDLIEGSFDLALRNSVMQDSSLIARKLTDDRRLLCAAPMYLEKAGVPTHPDHLLDHHLIGFHDVKPRKLVTETGDVGFFSPHKGKRHLLLSDGINQKVATLAGAGISLNSIWSIHEELRTGQLVEVLPQYKVEDDAALWLMYPKSNVLTAKVRVFMDFLLDRLGHTPLRPHGYCRNHIS